MMQYPDLAITGTRDHIIEVGPWYEPFTLDGWNTWEVAPHPIYTPRPEIHARRWKTIEAALPNIDGWKVLDVGCLEGYNATRFAQCGATVTAIDSWDAAITRARLVASILHTGVRLEQRSVHDAAGRYDLVVMTNILYMLRNPYAAIRHAATLAPRLLVWCRIGTPSKDGPGSSWTPSELALTAVLHGSGYSTVTPSPTGDPSSALVFAEI